MKSEIEHYENLFLRVADDDEKAVEELRQALAQEKDSAIAELSEPLHRRWEDAAEMALENDTWQEAEGGTNLLCELARAGWNNSNLEDSLTRQIRRSFAGWGDPAGLFYAIGIRNEHVPPTNIPTRWNIMESLTSGILCCHPWHGPGKITDIDDLSNEVSVKFQRVIVFPLSVFLDKFHLIREKSLLSDLIQGRKKWTELSDADPAELREQIMNSFVPRTDSPAVAEAALVPSVIAKREFAAVYKPEEKVAEINSEPSQEVADEEEDSAPVWRVKNARSLVELKEILESTRETDFDPEDIENARRLMELGASRSDQVAVFVEVLLLIKEKAKEAAWVKDLLSYTGREAICWQEQNEFIRVTENLGSKRLPSWLTTSIEAVGPEKAASLGLHLPLKSITALDRSLTRWSGDKQFFARSAAAVLQAGRVSADLVVWLWLHADLPEKETIADPDLTLRALATEVNGPFLKASRQLRNMLIQDEEFQKFIMRQGEPTAIKKAVNSVRNYGEALTSGERQSLLVRFARLYPQVRQMLEKKAARRSAEKAEAGPPEPITSIRSYEARREELRDIIKRRIPANTQAIAHARSFGDLRENAEYKAAKEEQAHLSTRREEMEQHLNQVRPTDFSEINAPNRAVPGCTVRLRTLDDEDVKEFHLAGAWDSDPEKKVIAYETPLGRSILGKSSGEQVETPLGKVVIEEIRPFDEKLREWLASSSGE